MVWLKLNPALHLLGQQVAVVEDCSTNQLITRTSGNPGDIDSDIVALELRGGVLSLTSQADDYTAKRSTVTTLRYLHQAPQQGLIVSEKSVPLSP